jgi:hypothetical protein
MGRGVQVVQRGYCSTIQNEFDLLILEKRAKRLGHTSVYRPKSIVAAIEVKTSLAIYPGESLEQRRLAVEKRFSPLIKALGDIPLFYLAYWHRNDAVEAVKAVFKENAFFLRRESADKWRPREWNRLIEALKAAKMKHQGLSPR